VTEGGVTTTTTATTDNAPAPEESDQCKANPQSVGCAKLGDLPTDQPESTVRDVTFAEESLGFTGACPAPNNWVVHGISLTWGYQPICDIAPIIRLALIAIAAFSAAAIIIRGVNT